MKEHKGCTAIHDIFYSLTARYQILYFDMKNEMDERWNEMNEMWNGVKYE